MSANPSAIRRNLRLLPALSGEIRGDVSPLAGNMVEKGSLLFEIMPGAQSIAIGYLPTEYLATLTLGDEAPMVRNTNALSTQRVRVRSIDQIATQIVEYPELLSSWGGELVDMNQSGVPTGNEQIRLFEPHHKVTFEFDAGQTVTTRMRESGVVIASQNQISFAQQWWTLIQMTLIRELQF
jgi:hypothetical protein